MRRLRFMWFFTQSSTSTNPNLGECIQKFPDWTPGARTANGTSLCY